MKWLRSFIRQIPADMLTVLVVMLFYNVNSLYKMVIKYIAVNQHV
jgi:hypothetical protein